jgi:Co/Zn/Cd efflux system component
LKEAGERNASIRLAYVHNLGDVWVSLAPVAAGSLLILTGYSLFDPLVAGAIAIWLIVTTALAVLNAHDELIWPENIACCHTEPGAIAR